MSATDAKRTQAWLEAMLREQPQMPAEFRYVVASHLGEVTYSATRDLDKALAVYDGETLPAPDEAGASLWSLAGFWSSRAHVMTMAGKPKESAEFLQKQWPQIMKIAKTGSNEAQWTVGNAADHFSSALVASKQPAQAATMLQKLMCEMPVFLVSGQVPDGAFLDRLVSSLSVTKKPSEALGWAKLRYMTCDFKPQEIAAATRTLSQAWASNDDFESISAFNRVQQPDAQTPTEDAKPKEEAKVPTSANPLAKVELPTAGAAWRSAIEKQIATLEATDTRVPQQKVHEQIGLLIALGGKSDFGRAMTLAKKNLSQNPESTDAAREVCRVFKAADLNTIRANQFIDYMGGKAKSPFTDFNKEYPAPDAEAAE